MTRAYAFGSTHGFIMPNTFGLSKRTQWVPHFKYFYRYNFTRQFVRYYLLWHIIKKERKSVKKETYLFNLPKSIFPTVLLSSLWFCFEWKQLSAVKLKCGIQWQSRRRRTSSSSTVRNAKNLLIKLQLNPIPSLSKPSNGGLFLFFPPKCKFLYSPPLPAACFPLDHSSF